tara:strand:- start:389 stop:712 length:324 start_codon:yes stop_codon:yes gene_type:complete
MTDIDLLAIPDFLKREPSNGPVRIAEIRRTLTVKVRRPQKPGKRTQARLKALLWPDSAISSFSQETIAVILAETIYYTCPAFKSHWDKISRDLDELARQRAAKLKAR